MIINNIEVQFGYGDVIISGFIDENNTGYILLQHSNKQYKIGDKECDEFEVCNNQSVFLSFKKIESIDELIGQLEKVKVAMIERS